MSFRMKRSYKTPIPLNNDTKVNTVKTLIEPIEVDNTYSRQKLNFSPVLVNNQGNNLPKLDDNTSVIQDPTKLETNKDNLVSLRVTNSVNEPSMVCCTGSTGPKGDDGKNGCVGPMGPKGDDGKNGCVGSTGPKGNDGKNGCVGSTGPKGNDGKNGCVGPMGPKGNDGKSQKSLLYNNEVLLENSIMMPVVTIPYNGILYNLDECIVVLDSPTGVCKLELVDMTDNSNEVICGTLETTTHGLQIGEWNNFHDLKNKMSILQIRGQADKTRILALELNMSRI